MWEKLRLELFMSEKYYICLTEKKLLFKAFQAVKTF